MTSPPEDRPDPGADSLFARWLASRRSGDGSDFDALCLRHPAASTRLRHLHERWQEIADLERRFGLAGTVAERLARTYGSGIDPQVELEGEGPTDGDFTARLLGRLSGRSSGSQRYREKGEVASGGMGAILRVWDEDLRRHLAMKVMLGRREPSSAEDSPRDDRIRLARFLEEAQVTGQLDHPGVVPVHELGLDADGRVYFTMKLVRGQTLMAVFDLLSEGAEGWTQVRALGVLLRVCEAMSYAHDKGVIHRDLKPANVMVGRYGEVYVMDWGLAKVLGREDGKDLRIRSGPTAVSGLVRSDRGDQAGDTPGSPLFTMDGEVVGTPAYMSPEQAAGRVAEMDARSDVYALGALLYHLLAGHMPYVPGGTYLDNYAVWQRVQVGPPQPLAETAPDAPPELVAICEKAMARDPAARFAGVGELARDLSAYLEGRVVRAYEHGAWAEARKWVRRNRPLAAALLAALALAIGGLGGIGYVQAKGRAAERVQRERADFKAGEAEDNLVLARKNELRAEENFALAQRSAAQAEVNARAADAERNLVLGLADVQRLADLLAEADELWPPHPERRADLEAWRGRAEELVGRSSVHTEHLAKVRARLSGIGRSAGLPNQRPPEAGVRSESGVEDRWLEVTLMDLIAGLVGLDQKLLADDGVSYEHGWSVPKRLAFARALEVGFAQGGELAWAWEEALPAIGEAYPGLELRPQMGLFPLGPDPESGLWEFAHLQTGEAAHRDSEGKLAIGEATGVVLVLLPGESFWMGAQPDDSDGRNYDPLAQDEERPVHAVELQPYFLSKYEMTQAQWLRLAGDNPSYYKDGPYVSSLLHPVEQVSWIDCMRWLPRTGLALPTEAQWEHAARGMTDTPWWTGGERESLLERHAVNLADRSAARAGVPWLDVEDWPELDDGYVVHAPVGTFAANDFGLHEMAGNLWEWCLDGYDETFYARSPGFEPLNPWQEFRSFVCRGGGYDDASVGARSAARRGNSPDNRYSALGVRPARRVEP